MIAGLVARATTGGGALLVRGDAGIGKSVLLEAAVGSAQATGMRTLRMAGLIEVLKGRTTLAEVFRVTPNDT